MRIRRNSVYPDWYCMDDKILIKAHLKGDKTAFEALVKKYENSVGRLCYSILKNEASVPDVVQDVFLSVYRGLKKFRGDASFKTWLYKIAVHESLRYLKKLQRRESFTEFTDNPKSSSEVTLVIMDDRKNPERMLLNAQQRQLIQNSIEQLSEHHRVVLHLHYQEDLPVQEIAEILNIPIGSVKSRLYYARVHLKELLTPFFKYDVADLDQEGEENVL